MTRIERMSHRFCTDFTFVGQDLVRPEFILTTASGALVSCDDRAAVAITSANGDVDLLGTSSLRAYGIVVGGIAIRDEGTILLANRGEAGGIWTMNGAGEVTPVATEADGAPLAAIGSIATDVQGRIWATTCSSVEKPNSEIEDDSSCVLLIDRSGVHVVAWGLMSPGQVCIYPDGTRLLVPETMHRRIVRYRINGHGALTDRTEVVRFEHGVWPVGMALDCENGIWVTSTVSGRIVRVDATGRAHRVWQDCADSEADEEEEGRCEGRQVSALKTHLSRQRFGGVAAIVFGGRDLKTVYLGSATARRCAMFRSAVAGVAPGHWTINMPSISHGAFARSVGLRKKSGLTPTFFATTSQSGIPPSPFHS